MEKKMETTIMENQMEKKMENEMETREYIGVILGLYGDNGKENENYYIVIGLNRVYIWVILGRMEKKMETIIMGYIGAM